MSTDLTLVTGFPRVLAKCLARELLARPETHIALLVRPSRLELAQGFLSELGEERARRVELLEGDVTSLDLGLPGRDWLALARRVTAIQHAAQVTSDSAEGPRTERVNVQGTREVLELAREAPELRRLVAYSSTLVAGDARGTVREEDFDLGQRFRSPVEASLWRAEALLRRAREKLPVTIVRPSLVVGDSRTGEVDQLEGPYLFLLLLLNAPAEVSLPLPGRGDAPLDLVPVDYVARAGLALAEAPEALGRTFHVLDPAPTTARAVFEAVARAAGRRLPRGFIPMNLTRAFLSAPGIERIARSPRAFLERLAPRATFRDDGARALLGARGLRCPPFESYVDPLVAWVRSAQAPKAVDEPPEAIDDALL
ncbi:MAG: SDR family oxidoreductase [Deltaproteobacteria bacterium]|nr:SDR family oxidoreductase [Deltaproteobacteria bacterium]